MRTSFRLSTAVTAAALSVVPLALGVQAQAVAPQSAPSPDVGVTVSPVSSELDLTIIKALKSKDHTTAVGRVRVSTYLEPDATVWTSTKRSVTTSLAWNIRDVRDVAERVRICADDPELRREQCASYPLKATRGSRGPVQIRALSQGWQVLVRPSYDARTLRECRAERSRGGLATWGVTLVDVDAGRVVGRGESSWRVRCGR